MSSGNLPFSNGDSRKPPAQWDNSFRRAVAGGGRDGDDRGEGQEKEEQHCICGRPRHSIKCTNCLHVFFGRLRLTCPAHPEVFFLMDIFNCSKCGASRNNLLIN